MPDTEIVGGLGLIQPIPGLDMKAPQLLALEYIRQEPKTILSFDKGMGKTVTYLQALISSGQPKIILMCSKNAQATQRKEIRKWFPELEDSFVIIDSSDRTKRAAAWNLDVSIYICSPITFLTDMGERAKSSGRIIPPWAESAAYCCDEFHRYLRTRKSKLFDLMKRVSKTCSMLILSSGSAGGKGPQDTWAALHLTNRKKFSAYWRYVYDYCEVQEGHFGKTIGRAKNIVDWRRHIASNTIHRRKDLKDYPVKTRQSLDVTVPPWQKTLHDKLIKDFWLEMPDGEIVLTPNVMAALMKVRQALICPKVLSPSYDYGVGLEAIYEDFVEAELTHAVITTPFLAPIPWIDQYFGSKGIKCWTLTGAENLDADEQDRRINEWTQKGGLIIQTTKYATSYELPAARIMYMLGQEYDPEDNDQAESRIHRDIRVTPHPVDIYYVRHLGTIEEGIVQQLSDNADNNYNAWNRPLSEVFSLTRA